MPVITGGIEYLNQRFSTAAEHFDPFIETRARTHPKFWFDRIPKGTMSMYNGLSQKTNVFRGGLLPQAGLTNFRPIQLSRKASATDAGYDSTSYDPQMFTTATEVKSWSGVETSWQSEIINMKDMRFIDQAKEQLALYTDFMAKISIAQWEVYNRETYIKTAVDAGKACLLTERGLDVGSPTLKFYYDPYVADSDGNTFLLIPVGSFNTISTINWTYLDYIQDYISQQCPEAAPAMDGEEPVPGLMLDVRDVDRMIMRDDNLREDLRYRSADILFDDYRKVKKFRGWALLHDAKQARWQPVGLVTNPTAPAGVPAGTYMKCVRVLPEVNGRAGVIGNIPTTNEEYTKAELAFGVVYLKDVIQNLMTPTIPNPGSGMVFGAKPGFNGEFTWINEYDRKQNMLRETGFFFGRYEVFTKPLKFWDEPIVFLYRRVPSMYATTESHTVAGPSLATSATVAANAASGDEDTDNISIALRLTARLNGAPGAAITMTGVGGTSPSSGYILSSDGVDYVFGFASGTPVYSDYTTAVTVTLA